MDEQQRSGPGSEGVTRRRFIGLTLLGSLIATMAGVLTPVIAYLWPPSQTTATSNLRVQVGLACFRHLIPVSGNTKQPLDRA
jgi:hypothetical protein